MTDPRIRRASAEDAEPLAQVYRSAYRENRRLGFPAEVESATSDEVAEWIREHGVFVAEIEGNLVGGVRLEATGPDRVKLIGVIVGSHRFWQQFPA